jgi:hypothetical protein
VIEGYGFYIHEFSLFAATKVAKLFGGYKYSLYFCAIKSNETKTIIIRATQQQNTPKSDKPLTTLKRATSISP